MNARHAAIPALLFQFAVHAAGPRVGVEHETAKNRDTGAKSRSLGVRPGWEFAPERLVNVVELILEGGEAAERDGSREAEHNVFLRLRHNGRLAARLGYHLRGGAGRSYEAERRFSYAYVEPALHYDLARRWEWTLAARRIDSIDGTPGERVVKIITGPSYALRENAEVELRHVRGRGDQSLSGWSLSYVHRF